jgi:predicted kinase
MSRIAVFAGPPLSGKSTLATAYGSEAGVPVLEMELIRLEVLPDSRQSMEDRNVAYRCMHYTAERLLKCGVQELVLVATYTRREIRRELVNLAARCGAQLYVFQLRVAAECATERFAARAPGHAAAGLNQRTVWDQAVRYPYCHDSPILDTTSVPPAATLATVVKYLNRKAPMQAMDLWVESAV